MRRAQAAGLKQVSFRQADASADALPAGRDLLFSRFGIMFFEAPGQAFLHLRKALAPTGRIAFCCWRTPEDNPWAVTPLQAARAAMNIEAMPADPHAPGPFAFSDDLRVAGFLGGAGFSAISIERFDAPVWLGASLAEASANALKFGPVGRFVRQQGAASIPLVSKAVENALRPFAGAGGVAPPGSVWIVTAKAQ